MTHVLMAPGLIARWAKFYSDSKTVSASITFVHLAGVMGGGGLALAADRASLKLAPVGSADRGRQLTELAQVHPWVVGGLGVILASGLMMLFADLNTYLTSAVYWTKMSLVAVLLLNGYVRLRAERLLLAGTHSAERRFRGTSMVSVALWLSILLAGTLLTTIS